MSRDPPLGLRPATHVPYLTGTRFLTFGHAREFYAWFRQETRQRQETRALLGLCDRYYLLTEILGRADMLWHGDPGEAVPAGNVWLYERCREVEANPNGRLDLWARDHYKSTIITYGGVIQEVLRDPEVTIGIFSYIRPAAKKFLRQIKDTFERHDYLKTLYADVLSANPRQDSPKWSEDEGIVVNRKSTPKEATIEAWGLIDGMPTGAHFKGRVYDDLVTEKSVTSPEMVAKVTAAWELSDNLGTKGGWAWHIGTRYGFADTYQTILDRKSLVERLYPATHDGTVDGQPVFLSPAENDKKLRDQGMGYYSQMLLNPAAGENRIFLPTTECTDP